MARKLLGNSIFIFGVVLLSLCILVTFNKIGSWVNLSRVSIKDFETLAEENENLWKEYIDTDVYFRYPLYLSGFSFSGRYNSSHPSVIEAVRDDVLVANYGRYSDSKIESRGKQSDSHSGRSYTILLGNPLFETEGTKDIKKWIKDNKLNINPDNLEEFDMEETELGGQVAYSIKHNKSLTTSKTLPFPVFEQVFFMTKQGVRYLGFNTSTNDEFVEKDYRVFKKILSTFEHVE